MIKLAEQILFADRYQFQRLLGRGGFSEVWLAIDKMTNLEIAVKVYAPGQGMDSDGMKTFCKELSQVYNLNHTNLLKPQHVDSWEGMPYLVMTYCPQGSCHRLIGTMTEEQIWKMLHDVSSGLAYLHEQGIIHQDIKPDNILVDPLGNYVITDFGISVQSRSTLRKSMNIATGSGTTAYMGPERFSKNPTPIKASDIWSLGATAYELIAGNVPFGEIGGGLQKGGADIPTIKQNISSELRMVLAKMLSAQTWDRPTAEQLVKWTDNPHYLDVNSINSNDSEVRPSVVQSPPNNYMGTDNQQGYVHENIIETHRNKTLKATIIVLCLVVFAFGGYFYYDYTQTQEIEKGIEIIHGLRDDCDSMISSLHPGPEGLKNLDNAIIALRKLDDFENMFKEHHPKMKKRNISSSDEAMAIFIAKISELKNAINESMRTTMAHFDKKSIMYLGAQHRLDVLNKVLFDWEKSENKSAKDIHIDADNYMN